MEEATKKKSTSRRPTPRPGPPEPIIPKLVRIGRTKKQRIRKLKQGRGPLMTEIQQIVDHELAKLGPPEEGKTYQPVVVVYQQKKKKRKKRKRRRGDFLSLGFPLSTKKMYR